MISYDCVTELNEIINHPEIIGGHIIDGIKPPLDVSPCFADGGFGSMGDGYGFLFSPVAECIFEVHTSILPDYRNKSFDITIKTMGEVFTQTNTLEIVTRIKDNNPAKNLTIAVGMRKTFDRSGYEYFSIYIAQWAAQAEQFKGLGKEFHTMLEDNGVETDHGADDNHDQYVGISVAMARAGMYEKSIWFYNCWAKLSDFYPAELIEGNKVFIGNAIIEITEHDMKVMTLDRGEQ